MSKARMTIKLDPARENHKSIIPLSREDYRVEPEQEPVQAAPDEWPSSIDHWEVPGESGVTVRGGSPEVGGFQSEKEVTTSTNRGRDFNHSAELNPFLNDYSAWSTPIDPETERVERMIRNSDPEPETFEQPRRSNESMDRGPVLEGYGTWSSYMGEESGRTSRSASYRKRSDVPWLRVVISVTGAVVTGLAIGSLALQLFTGSDTLEVVSGDPARTGVAGEAGAVTAGAAVSSNGTEVSGPAVAAAVQAASYVVLQNGVFSEQQGAQNAVDALKKKGLAASVYQEDNKYFVYAGMTKDRDQALALSRLLQKEQFEVFIKPLEIPAVAQIQWSGANADAPKAFFAQLQSLADMIGALTALHLDTGATSKLADGTVEKVKSAHQSFNTAAAKMSEGAAPAQAEQVKAIGNAMNTAVRSMEEYAKQPNAAYLWQAQSASMDAMIAQKTLLSAAAVQ
ncbi:SPOR domain-containing protein [Paenibacillus turpanensis]|uniref:SPOR domain-containing protein n=1 Tax=Paenibacillus turpanensis TaxID=2689078 RepID=UPI00140C92A7|nr:SPOR domain-containing protein [Paenibacillus turpanensis]